MVVIHRMATPFHAYFVRSLAALIGSDGQLLDTGNRNSGAPPKRRQQSILIAPDYAASSRVLDVACLPNQ
jgi:hypothetical protein